MPRIITVKPAEGRQVRDPLSKKPIPAEGVEVESTSYWLRRITAGDVVGVPTGEKTAAKKTAPKTGGKE